MDKLNNHIRIIDYKTGKDELKFKNIESLFSDKKESRNNAVFQTFLYSKLYLETKKPDLPITPGIYSVRKIFDHNYEYKIKQTESNTYISDYNQIAGEYFENLTQLIHSIFDPSEAFCQTEDENICKYCDYRKICHR